MQICLSYRVPAAGSPYSEAAVPAHRRYAHLRNGPELHGRRGRSRAAHMPVHFPAFGQNGSPSAPRLSFGMGSRIVAELKQRAGIDRPCWRGVFPFPSSMKRPGQPQPQNAASWSCSLSCFARQYQLYRLQRNDTNKIIQL